MLRFFAVVARLCLAFSLSGAAFAAPPTESELVARARELVDTYYGDRRNLEAAAELLARAYVANPADANLFVQAARITVMGGRLKFGEFEAGTFERYGALLDKALALDASNAKAHILKAEVFGRQGKRPEQLMELDKAKALKTRDPWLQIGYGYYFDAINDLSASYAAYSDVLHRGPGQTASERKAYVTALNELWKIRVPGERTEDKLRKHAELALSARYPTDAWTPHGYAERFIDFGLFQDAIAYARAALKTMDFGAGRMTLAAALYARAAQLQLEKRPSREIEPLLMEARSFRFSKSSLLEYLLVQRGFEGRLKAIEPALRAIIP